MTIITILTLLTFIVIWYALCIDAFMKKKKKPNIPQKKAYFRGLYLDGKSKIGWITIYSNHTGHSNNLICTSVNEKSFKSLKIKWITMLTTSNN